MTYEQLMHKSLNDMLEEGEKLYHPVYGCVLNGGVTRYAYFGFTDDHLLIAFISDYGKKITGNIRIPLEIEAVEERDSRFLGQRTVDIYFKNGESYKILISPKVMMIKEQKAVFPSFFEYLASKTPSFEKNDLKKKEGTVIRKQFLFFVTFFMLSIIPALMLLMIYLDVIDYGETEIMLSDYIATLILSVLLVVLPLCLLSFIHRMWFGKRICVIDRNGIYLPGSFISFREIKGITYTPDLGGRHRLSNSILHVTVKKADGREYTARIEHFPLYGLYVIKKYAPAVHIKWDRGAVVSLVICAALPVLIGILVFVFGG